MGMSGEGKGRMGEKEVHWMMLTPHHGSEQPYVPLFNHSLFYELGNEQMSIQMCEQCRANESMAQPRK